eukprot:TRINITY_DN3066_c0_g2_i1.p2 TRINITY_DN3066_c0_g2~~TRINITY_DN3066_c0_g2_i1.p2  ORF type:complete len:105 (+),score=12.27 TRINITY_DN3066_c0_g2_i1:677-991(+)
MINSINPVKQRFKNGQVVNQNVKFGRLSDLTKYSGVLPIRAYRYLKKDEELIISYGRLFWTIKDRKRKLTEDEGLPSKRKGRRRLAQDVIDALLLPEEWIGGLH